MHSEKVRAKTAESQPVLATHYDVAFAYAKLTGTTPNYTALLEADRSWRARTAFEQINEKENRLDELKNKFSGFSPMATPLTVRLPVRIHISEKPFALVVGYLSDNLPYFPFWDGTRVLTLYTPDLSFLSILPVEDKLALRRASYLIDEQNDFFLDLIPQARPALTSYQIDGQGQILIPARVARVRLYNKGGAPIWEWHDPRAMSGSLLSLPRR